MTLLSRIQGSSRRSKVIVQATVLAVLAGALVGYSAMAKDSANSSDGYGVADATDAALLSDRLEVASRSQERHELAVQSDATSVTVSVQRGAETSTVTASGATVRDVLQDQGVVLAENEVVVPGLDEAVADGAVISIGTTVTSMETVTAQIPFETVEQESATLDQGTTKVQTEGTAGVSTTTYAVSRIGTTEVSRSEVVSHVTQQPVTRVVLIGTKAPQIVAPVETAVEAGSAETGASTAGSDVWAALAQCESGGNPATNTGNGYYGLYQFSLSTWRSMGGTGLPSEASAEEQTARAQALQARSGWGQWPACTKKLGLR